MNAVWSRYCSVRAIFFYTEKPMITCKTVILTYCTVSGRLIANC